MKIEKKSYNLYYNFKIDIYLYIIEAFINSNSTRNYVIPSRNTACILKSMCVMRKWIIKSCYKTNCDGFLYEGTTKFRKNS